VNGSDCNRARVILSLRTVDARLHVLAVVPAFKCEAGVPLMAPKHVEWVALESVVLTVGPWEPLFIACFPSFTLLHNLIL